MDTESTSTMFVTHLRSAVSIMRTSFDSLSSMERHTNMILSDFLLVVAFVSVNLLGLTMELVRVQLLGAVELMAGLFEGFDGIVPP